MNEFAKRTINCSLFFFNFLLAIEGLVLLILGIVIIVYIQQINDITQSDGSWKVSIVSIGLLIMGAFIVLIAFFGSTGAIKESRGCLLIYGVILVIMFILQLWAAFRVFVIVNNDAYVKQSITDSFLKILEKAKNGDKPTMELMDSMQTTFRCCGVNNPIDWGIEIPKSCFKNGNDFMRFQRSCRDKLLDILNLNTIMLVMIILNAVELISFVLTFILTSSFQFNTRNCS